MDMSRKKPQFPTTDALTVYLKNFGRSASLPIHYEDLINYDGGIAVLDQNDNDTLWRSVFYQDSEQQRIHEALLRIYALLKTDGDLSFTGQLRVDRIDHCLFGNSNPFRIRIANQINDNHDYYYIKKTDASRIYGLEFEHILSPNRIGYLVDGKTMIEEHIAGIPGDIFIAHHMDRPNFSRIRMAKEFVKFNERCFVMLLGDMRSYNYVVVVTPDFDMEQYRVRPIDFDQLTYEGRKNHYMPQFYKENLSVVQFCMEVLTPETVAQYQAEERTLIKRRYDFAQKRIRALLSCMEGQPLSSPEKIKSLREDMDKYYQTSAFSKLESMGAILRLHLASILNKTEKQVVHGKTAYKTADWTMDYE